MFEFYPQIKLLHVLCVALSGALFALRASSSCLGANWPLAAPWRYLSYCIDTALLTAAMMLLTLLPRGYFANGWLWAKLLLLACYVVLGSFALKRGRTRKLRVRCLMGAIACYLMIASIALTHHPLGVLQSLGNL